MNHAARAQADAVGSVLTRTVGTAVLAALLLLLFCAATVQAQTISASLSGFVEDQTGAIVPGASVTLTNQSSKDKRATKTDSAGLFSFAAVPSGTYQVQISLNGFDSFVERDIILNPADRRTLEAIKLQVGSVQTEITVRSTGNNMPTEGAKSTVITSEDIANLPVQGRDVTELIKTLPGFAQTAQGSGADNVGPNQDTVGSQTGNYTANGVTPEGVQIISDGVNITDPGNESGTDQVINMDNVAEVKVQMSNFGADSAKGPIVINAVGKSGSSVYHGELYVYGRTYQLNTQDWFSKYDQDAKPKDRYIYPGFNIGGPVRIPGTDFNHAKKWTFFLGAEDYVQRNVYAYGSAQTATLNALVPTCAMRGLGATDASFNCTGTGQAADFSESSLTNFFGGIDPVQPDATDPGANNCSPTGQLHLYQNICGIPQGGYPFASGTSMTPNGPNQGSGILNGQLAANQLDPGAMAYMLHVIPLPNTATFSRAYGTSTGVTDSFYNYKAINLENNDSYQARIRSDYNFSENSHLYVVYSFQHSDGVNPQQTYYSPQDAFGEINTPGSVVSADFAHTGSLNYTLVLTPSLTNEFYVGVNYNYGVVNALNGTATKSSTIGYPYQGIYPTNQFPQLDDYGYDGLPLGIFPDFSTPVFQHKFVPNFGDNLTKVIRTHNIKVGTYIERSNTNETNLNDVSQGQIQNYYDGPNNAVGSLTEPGTGNQLNTQGNYLASFELGLASAFNQYNFQTNSDLYYWDVDFYATDSWKATKKLTLDYGFRVGHLGPWQDNHGLGLAVWDPALYTAQTTPVLTPILSYTGVYGVETKVNVPGLVSPGFKWHGVDNTVPNSGAGSRALFFSPRFGLAYDVYGDGKTIVRGGIGLYRSHDAWNDVSAAAATSEGQAQSYVGGGGLALRDIYKITHGANASLANPTGSNGCGCLNTSFGLQQGDTEQPLTYTYSLTVDQQFGPNTVFEMSYQGSQSTHLLTQWEQGAPGDLENINALPIGSFFKPDPYTGAVLDPSDIVNDDISGDYRQFPYYSQVNVIRHALYSNYNGLQVSIRRTQGRLLYSVNYTWSKNMGVFGAYGTGNVIDSSNIRPNYGPLQGDRSDVLNSTFSYNTGKFLHGNRFVRGALSGYGVSGIVNLQSGPNVQRVLGSNLGLSGQISNPPGSPSNLYTNYPISDTTYLGTTDVVLQPALLCDPRSGINHAAHQYLNPNCFALPQFGVNGPAELPYIHAPGYFDFDARISRQIDLHEKQNLQVQFSAFNVINRANYSFSSKFPEEQTLQFYGYTPQGLAPSSAFGTADFRFGRRVSEISIKYNF
ncbi:MAG: carboxypeptidase regulatory-like domain-containing protein [Acidobacteriaceae bacterium]